MSVLSYQTFLDPVDQTNATIRLNFNSILAYLKKYIIYMQISLKGDMLIIYHCSYIRNWIDVETSLIKNRPKGNRIYIITLLTKWSMIYNSKDWKLSILSIDYHNIILYDCNWKRLLLDFVIHTHAVNLNIAASASAFSLAVQCCQYCAQLHSSHRSV